MKILSVFLEVVVVGLLIASCATQRYGRLQQVTPTESKMLSCELIELEIEKCNYFIKETNDKDDEFTGSDVLGFLGDFGIGNSMEHTSAIKSATDRLVELTELKREKNCIVDADNPKYHGTPFGQRSDIVTDENIEREAEKPKSAYLDLIELDELRKKGIITEDEFEEQKRKILSRN